MKNWKKYTVLFMTCCLALCTLASAATNDGTFTGYSNRQGYTPRSADILLTSSKVYFDKLKWDSSSRGASEYWEGELRGVDPQAESIAVTNEIDISYICVPEKPDGTQ